MIGIGINNNVYFGKAAKDTAAKEERNRGTLMITFKQKLAGDEAAGEMKAKLAANPFADWEDGGALSYSEGGNSITLRMFPFDSKAQMNTPDVLPDATEMRNRINQLRDPLVHILSQYMTSDKITLKPAVIFAGTGIDIDVNSFGAKVMSEPVQEKIYNNIVNEFIKLMTPFEDSDNLLFRLKLPRQSKKKAYATIPTRFLNGNPFMEDMAIPEKASKVKFSSYEINNGFDNATPIAQAEADTAKEVEPANDPFANQ